MSRRIVAVLGYSGRRKGRLHPVCAERLTLAQELAAGADAVIFSGRPEAELMKESWAGPDVLLICDSDARSTAENAANVAATARALAAEELVVVTSHWHRARVRVLLARALVGSGIRVSIEAAGRRRGTRLLTREVACLALLPLQLPRAAAGARRRRAPETL